jgi:hypothetical protein
MIVAVSRRPGRRHDHRVRASLVDPAPSPLLLAAGPTRT